MFNLTDNYSVVYCSHMATDDSYTVFIKSLTTAVNLTGESRKSIATKAGIHVATLNRILNGDREASVPTMFALAKATNTNPIRLIDGSLCKECITQ